MSTPDAVEVHLLQLPLDLWERSQQQSDALQREFALLVGQDGGHDVPRRLLDLIAALQAQYGNDTTAQEEELLDAVDRGEAVLDDLVYVVPAAVGQHAHELGVLLDEADAHCRAGQHLLTLAADDEQVRFRWWYLDQFSEQAAGREPVAWPDYVRAD